MIAVSEQSFTDVNSAIFLDVFILISSLCKFVNLKSDNKYMQCKCHYSRPGTSQIIDLSKVTWNTYSILCVLQGETVAVGQMCHGMNFLNNLPIHATEL